MLVKNSLILITFIAFLSRKFAFGSRCELKALIGNRVQCVLHDRKRVTSDKYQTEDIIEENGSWLLNFVKGMNDEIEEAINAKYSQPVNLSKPLLNKLLEEFKKSVTEQVSGTRWCDDPVLTLPENTLVKTCCTTHENCKSVIQANETRFGLTNTGLHVRSHCDCDKQFYYCLKAVNDEISEEIGYAYFTVLEPQCFRIEYPIIRCLTKTFGRCTEYKFDMEKRKTFQWFDNPLYRKK